MEQQNLFKVRDRRKKGWFFMDNEYLNGYAKLFGAVGTAVYVSLCRHADNETQKCFPSLELISEELSISRPTIIKYIKLFEKHHLLEKSKRQRNIKQQWINNEYTLLDKSEWLENDSQVKPFNTDSQVKPFSNPSKTDSDSQVKPFNTKDTHINYTHTKETHIATANAVADKEIKDFINIFKTNNPSYERLFNNKTERAAAERFIKKFGFNKALSSAQYAVSISGEQFAPVITTPYQLEKNIGKVISYFEKQRSRNSGVIQV